MIIKKARAVKRPGIFLLTLLLCALLTGITIISRHNMEKLMMEQLILVKSTRVKEVISRLTYKTESLAVYARQGNVEGDSFELIAASILDDPAVLCVMLAPSGIISNIYPPREHDLDIFTKLNAEGNFAKELVLGGPYDLGSGEQALLAKLPVYTEQFWGWVSIALRYPEVLDIAGLEELQLQGFAYEIWAEHPEHAEKQLIAASDSLIKNHKNFIEETVSILNAEWTFRILSVRAWYEYPEMWALVFVCVCICFLVAMLQRMTLRAKSASVAKSGFLASMSHEIRTPMNAIIGMSELLMLEELNERQKGYAKDINVSSTALLGIINDILDMSKIEAGKLTLSEVNFDFSQFIENVSLIISFAAKTKGLEFILDKDSSLPLWLYGDDIRLRQILINLLGNAVKFTDKGSVRLAANYRDGIITFVVTDTGIGIKEEDIDRLYDSFEQLDRKNNSGKQGTGLGLAITKSLVDMMGGTIHVSSVYGEGTSFRVELPIPCGDESQIEEMSSIPEFISAKEADVLLVDDNETNLKVGSGLLKLSDIDCDTASSGIEAIRKIQEKDYDIVFMDHMMPEMDGAEATAKIRALGGKYSSLVIIALTANASEEARKTLLDSGMNDFLAKPVDKALLSRMLMKWLPTEKQSTGTKPEKILESDYTPAIKLANSVDGLDITLGLSRVAGMEDYERSLRILSGSIPKLCEELPQFLENGELDRFAVYIHGLKGALAVNGHTGLSELAQKLENESKNGNLPFCRANLPGFLEKLTHFGNSLNEIFSAVKTRAKNEGTREMLAETLEALQDSVERYDRTAALNELAEITDYSFGSDVDEVIDRITESLENFDYELSLELIQTINEQGEFDDEKI